MIFVGTCDPIENYSVWSSLAPLNDTRGIVMITATLDNKAFFEELAIGSNAYMSGVFTSLVVADTLIHHSFPREYKKHVMFSFFNNEAWGFSGSKRFLNDIQLVTCKRRNSSNPNYCDSSSSYVAFKNIHLSSIEALIDLNQVASQEGSYFIHQDNPIPLVSNDLADLFVNVSEITYGKQFLQSNVALNRSLGLPPSPLHSFLLVNRSWPAIVLSDFSQQFSNKFYFSQYDRELTSNVNSTVETMCRLATVTAKAIYLLANEFSLDQLPMADNIIANCTLVSIHVEIIIIIIIIIITIIIIIIIIIIYINEVECIYELIKFMLTCFFFIFIRFMN